MICIPFNKKKCEEIFQLLPEAEEVGDLTEIWFDSLEDLTDENLEMIFSTKKKPIIYKVVGNTERLEKLLSFKPEYLDLDIETDKELIAKVKESSPETQIIISFHDFDKTPEAEELENIADRMTELGADIVKLATQANDFSDTVRMMDFLNKLSKTGKKTICICMGEEGKFLRAAGHLIGNYLMYAPMREEDKTAGGQITAKELWHLKSEL